MNILVACEESQAVTTELRKRGHTAYSCDIEPHSSSHDEWHIQQDVLPLLNGDCTFKTVDGTEHQIYGQWDMIIAFPPCTYLTCTGNRWFNIERYGDKARERYKQREEAIKFFMYFVNAKCDKIAIENPIGCMSTVYRKPDCYIQPYEFGDAERKKTCLWLKNLPPLKPTDIVEPELVEFKNKKTMSKKHLESWHLPPKERAKVRSKTFSGIAKAMAEQWTNEEVLEAHE